ncbi:MAG TPA: ATP-binding protein [Chryseosolibacter sp.]|nr:ATP-binding protein [Chryseosolibacter sp.]
MIYSSGTLSLVLAAGISLATALLLLLFAGANVNVLTIGAIVFAVSYAAAFYVLHTVFFNHIVRISDLIARLKGTDGEDTDRPAGNPLEIIREEFAYLAEQNEEEIERLKKLEAFRKEFIADVSHELKTPLFAAQGFVHTLLDGAVNDKTVRTKFLRKAAKSLDGLDGLVQDLLTLSQIETGQIKMHFELFDIHELTEEVFEQFENKSDRKEVSLRIESDNKRVFVYADRQRIAQVITNLISNAIKHSMEGGVVVVRFSAGKKMVEVSVEDYGEGIPAEHLPRIFERFYRVDKSRSREKGGTGLGLAIVKHILDGHNTKADVESIPGKGSVFSFKLPRKKYDKDGPE